MDLLERGGKFCRLVIPDALLKGAENVVPALSGHREDEREAKPSLVALVQLLEPAKLLGRTAIETGACLF
jgi:hypothetical protein